jgi:TolB protein
MSIYLWSKLAGLTCKFVLIAVAVSILISTAFGGISLDDKFQLTDSSNCDHPSWSPNGKRIAYSSEQGVWVINSDGTGAKKIFDALAWDGDPEYGHDGTIIHYASESKNAYSARYISIHSMGDEGGNIVKLTESADSRSPSASPDGTKIAYVSKLSGNYDVWVMDSDGSKNYQITDAPGDESSPSWSPDGSKIIYSSNGDIFTIETNSIRPVQLTDDSFDNIEPTYSPDGKLIIFASDRSGNYDIWMMGSDGNSIFRATLEDSIQKSPAWCPDGSSFAYVSNEAGEFNIWIMNLDVQTVEFEILEEFKEPDQVETNNAMERIRLFAVDNPEKFVLSVLVISFLFVVSVVYAFLSKIK